LVRLGEGQVTQVVEGGGQLTEGQDQQVGEEVQGTQDVEEEQETQIGEGGEEWMQERWPEEKRDC
jgi:hypothetical protein